MDIGWRAALRVDARLGFRQVGGFDPRHPGRAGPGAARAALARRAARRLRQWQRRAADAAGKGIDRHGMDDDRDDLDIALGRHAGFDDALEPAPRQPRRVGANPVDDFHREVRQFAEVVV